MSKILLVFLFLLPSTLLSTGNSSPINTTTKFNAHHKGHKEKSGEIPPLPVVHPDECDWFASHCSFGFYGFPSHKAFPIYLRHTKADRPLTSKIVSKWDDEKIGVVNTNGHAVDVLLPWVYQGSIPLGYLHVGGQMISPTQFKPLPMWGLKFASGIGYETFQREGHKKYLNGACIKISFSEYQVLDQTGTKVVKNVNGVTVGNGKCVVIKVIA